MKQQLNIVRKVILYLGFIFGHNVDVIDKYLSTYSNIVIGVTIIIIAILVIRHLLKKKKAQSENLK